MKRDLNDELIEYVIKSADSQSLRSVWCCSVAKDDDFEKQKENFLWVLKNYLNQVDLDFEKTRNTSLNHLMRLWLNLGKPSQKLNTHTQAEVI